MNIDMTEDGFVGCVKQLMNVCLPEEVISLKAVVELDMLV